MTHPKCVFKIQNFSSIQLYLYSTFDNTIVSRCFTGAETQLRNPILHVAVTTDFN